MKVSRSGLAGLVTSIALSQLGGCNSPYATTNTLPFEEIERNYVMKPGEINFLNVSGERYAISDEKVPVGYKINLEDGTEIHRSTMLDFRLFPQTQSKITRTSDKIEMRLEDGASHSYLINASYNLSGQLEINTGDALKTSKLVLNRLPDELLNLSDSPVDYNNPSMYTRKFTEEKRIYTPIRVGKSLLLELTGLGPDNKLTTLYVDTNTIEPLEVINFNLEHGVSETRSGIKGVVYIPLKGKEIQNPLIDLVEPEPTKVLEGMPGTTLYILAPKGFSTLNEDARNTLKEAEKRAIERENPPK